MGHVDVIKRPDVIPAEARIQLSRQRLGKLDPGFRRDDGEVDGGALE